VRAEITQAEVNQVPATTDNGNINRPTALTNHPVRAENTLAEVILVRATVDKGNITLPTALINHLVRAKITLAAGNRFPAKADKTKEVTKSLGPKALLPGKFSTTTTLRPFTKPFSGTNLTLKDTNTGQTQEFTPTT
jgi:hypothetical protein